MTERKQSQKQVLWPHLAQIPLVIAGLGGLIAPVTGTLSLGAGLLLFAAAVAASIALSAITMKSYGCPDCARPLTAPTGWWFRFPGRRIYLHCAHCDVDWDFGLTGQED